MKRAVVFGIAILLVAAAIAALDPGADPLLKDPEGKTALDSARSNAAGGIAEIIEDHLKKEGRL